VVFEIEWDISTAIFYSNKAEKIYSWNSNSTNINLKPIINDVIKSQTPVSRIICFDECTQYLVTPVIFNNRNTGIMIIGRPLSEIVLTYARIVGSDIAILHKHTYKNDKQNNSRHLVNWGYQIAAITNASNKLPILKNLSKSDSFDKLKNTQIYSLHNQKTYEIKALSLFSSLSDKSTQVILINDVTSHTLQIRRDIKYIIAAGLLGLLTSELLLLLLLGLPMTRIRKMSEILPSLAQGAYQKVRENILQKQARFHIPDEIDILTDTTITLSEQLESLNTEIEKNTKKLEQQRDALLLERDFNSDLLDTAQALILTHERNGIILSMNNYGTRLTGYDESEILGKDVSILFKTDEHINSFTKSLDDLRKGDEIHFQHESEILTTDGKHKNISWYHSRVSHTSSEDAIILSIGLDVTARHQAEERLGWIADHDTLTSLYNRRRFQSEFERILNEAIRYDRHGALLFIDLDHFKLVNDTSGHQAGDSLLRAVAESMKNATRDSDLLARLGGDEFALVIPEANHKEAMLVSQKIMNNLCKIDLPSTVSSYKTSGSIGITLFPDHGTNIQELMGNADIAMYQAKQRGRSICHMYSINEHAREQITERIQWKYKIDHALANDRFILHYQPILNISKNIVSHYEVLIRMLDGEDNIIPPGIFIPEAEQTGQIHTIDKWVITNAMKKLVEMNQSGQEIIFSVNLSGCVIDDPEILPFIQEALSKYNINPSQLVFEVTETSAVADMGSAIKLMHEIKNLGCQFALDDFGVGFSSFYYLKQLPVDYVKIDGAFISNLANDHADQLFVKALQQVAEGLGKKTIAEFVEDDKILQLLKQYGVDYAQGYHIGKPDKSLLTPVLSINNNNSAINKQSL